MQPVPAGYPIAELSGPYIVGCLLNWGLFGTLSVQLYLYYLAFPNDRRFTKYTVYGIYVIEFVQTILVAYDMFATFGYGFGDLDTLTRMHFYWLTDTLLNAVVRCVGQVFYAYRIFIVSKSRIISIFIICVSLTSSVAAIITVIYSFQAGDISNLNNWKISIAAGVWCGAAALCDILIAICMTYYASSFSHSVIFIIICLTIETGSVTAVVALLSFVLFVLFPHRAFFVTLGLLTTNLYANTIYMVLNSRFQILGGRDTYMSSTDMSFTTTMIRDITSQLGEGTRPVDGMQGQTPVVAIPNEGFNINYAMGQVSAKPQEGCMILPA
ncbi:hypothetical protein ARMSODRAFT_1011158 [Armillaria solidipes]|uniref:DUF6534 domain-containing protein n=1 Tax=Armillaria solidipes TaxID=1076256 RepID=A0A2H3C699_9AGAR|nr:hypothetical protein ARMSODRAFT_1011158 [Armillaria solidipes]